MNIEALKNSGQSDPIEVHLRISEDVDGLVWNIYWIGGRPQDCGWLQNEISDTSDKDCLVDGEMVKEDLGPGEYIAVVRLYWHRTPSSPNGPAEYDQDFTVMSFTKVS